MLKVERQEPQWMANPTVNCKKLTGIRYGLLPLIKGKTEWGLFSQPPPKPLLHKEGKYPKRYPPGLPGYTLVGAMLLIALMSIMMAISLPVWEQIKQRENEEELIFRGKEYMEAVGRYHSKFHTFPPDLETLYKMKFIRKLYKDPMTENGEWKVLHPDSLVETGEAGFINQPGSKKPEEKGQEREKKQEKREEGVIPGLRNPDKEEEKRKETSQDGKEISVGPVVGVVSQSNKDSLRIYNGQNTYDKWIFAFVPLQEQQPQQPKGPKVPDKGGKKPATQPKPPNNSDSN